MTRAAAISLLKRARELSNDHANLTFQMRDGTLHTWSGERMFNTFQDALNGVRTDDTKVVLTCRHSSVWRMVKLLRMCISGESKER